MASEQKNLSEIKKHLDGDEVIQSHILGAYVCKILGTETVRNGILVITSKRMVFFGKKLTGYDLEIFPFEKISSFSTGKELLGHKISFYATGNSVTIKWILSKNINEFISILKGKLEKETTKETTTNPAQTVFEKLRELKDLLDEGIISDEDFEEKKKCYLDKI